MQTNELWLVYKCYNQPLSGKLLKLVEQFIYIGSNISSTESDVNIRIAKALLTVIPYILWKYGDKTRFLSNWSYVSTTVRFPYIDANEMHGEKNATCCFEQILKKTTLKKSSCTATYLPSHIPSKQVKQDMLGTAEKIKTNL